jgi:hypothetical protein
MRACALRTATGPRDGKKVRFDTDPESIAWQRFEAGFTGILPVENQL